MPSTLTWLDHDPQERERVHRILSQFKERETRDELGLGGIRDSFADRLFPGTSTIQTKIRYMLFVPWMYQKLEKKQTSSRDIEKRARTYELSLVQPLLDAGETVGVLGAVARDTLKRLPSSVYWAGLESWRIRRFRGAQSQYHRSLDAIYRRRKRAADNKEEEFQKDLLTVTWHPKLPAPPDDFPHILDFNLRKDEALFFRDCIVTKHPQSLLAFLTLYGNPTDCTFPWEHPQFAYLLERHQELLLYARMFSHLAYGAALIYNLQLAELKHNQDWIDKLRTGYSLWIDELDLFALGRWSIPRLWELVIDQGHSITPRARNFVKQWKEFVISNPKGIPDYPPARNLIRQREMLLKKNRSRFTNQRALDQWSGKAGLNKISYRWPVVQGYINDIQKALGAEVISGKSADQAEVSINEAPVVGELNHA